LDAYRWSSLNNRMQFMIYQLVNLALSFNPWFDIICCADSNETVTSSSLISIANNN
jgi:hypothetical protein